MIIFWDLETVNTGYLDIMEPYTRFVVHKGFNIRNKCAAKRIHVAVSPGKQGFSQMLPSIITKTKLKNTNTS